MTDDQSRRTVLKGTGTALTLGAVGLAGCIGGDGGDDGGSGGDGGGAGLSGDDEGTVERSYPDWDPQNPEFPQPTDLLFDTDFHFGTDADLERFSENPRDEPRYGGPVREPDGDYLEPETLMFSYSSGEDAQAVYQDAFDPMMEALEEETGLPVEFVNLTDYAATVETMRAERLHVCSFATGNTPFGVNLAGAVPLAMLADDGRFGYRLWVITHADNDEIDELEDLAGKQVAHGHESSNSGNLAPIALFTNQGVVPGEDYEYDNIGAHENIARAIYHRDYDAGPICSTCMERALDDVDPEDVKVVWASDPFPPGPLCYRYNLHPDIVDGIERAILDRDYTGTTIQEETGRGLTVPVDYPTHWDVILQVHEANEIDYGDIDEL